MSIWRRVTNLFRIKQLNDDIDEELQSHFDEALAQGRNPDEARRAFGSPLRHREASRDARLVTALDSLRADAVFGLRQLRKSKITSAAAILSLALGMGLAVAGFRLIDAFLWRPLPVAHADRLHAVVRQGLGPSGDFRISDSNEYPMFVQTHHYPVRRHPPLGAVRHLLTLVRCRGATCCAPFRQPTKQKRPGA